jgi:hypothetical protein
MERKRSFVLEEIISELKHIADRFYIISDELQDYEESFVFISDVFSEKEKKEIQKLLWKAEDAIWELYKAFKKKIAELEKKLEDL